MEEICRLFSYGTLQEPEIQEILFEGRVEMQKAVLKNWRICCGGDGYFFIRREEGHTAEGHILFLTRKQLSVADCWEDVPDYGRISVCAYLEDDSACETWVYTRYGQAGQPVEHEGSSGLPIQQVIAEAKEMKKLSMCHNGR